MQVAPEENRVKRHPPMHENDTLHAPENIAPRGHHEERKNEKSNSDDNNDNRAVPTTTDVSIISLVNVVLGTEARNVGLQASQ